MLFGTVCFYQQDYVPHWSPLPKGDFMDILSNDCLHIHFLIPLLLSYSFNNYIHIFLKMSILIHCWSQRWHVEPEHNSEGSIFHWHSVLRTYTILLNTFPNGIAGRPIVLFDFSFGNIVIILSHSLSEILVMAVLFIFFTI
jgi:hypothetical protein